MKRIFFFLIALGLVLGMPGVIQVQAAPAAQALTPDPDALYVPGEVVVGFIAGQTASEYSAQATALAHEVGAQVVKAFDRFALLQFSEDADVLQMADLLAGQPGVAFAEPNYLRWIPEAQITAVSGGTASPTTEVELRVASSNGESRTVRFSLSDLRAMRTFRNGAYVPTYPNDTSLFDQWGWTAIGADIIWPDKAVNPGVCVVDSGVDKGHPDLKGRVLSGYDFVDDDLVPNDENAHGTHVAGIISALMNNKVGIGGISTAKIVPVRVMTAQGWGTSLDVALGILYCAKNTSVRIINLSLGGFGVSNVEYFALDTAINTYEKLVVAAAGNNSRYQSTDGKLFFPAAWAVSWVCSDGTDAYGSSCASGAQNLIADGLISVGAARSPGSVANDTNEDSKLWVDSNGDDVMQTNELFAMQQCATDFTNYGAWVELIAPGEAITSTTPVSYPYYAAVSSPYGTLSGTSQAAAHVSGAAARVWSVFSTDTAANIETRLKNGGSALVTNHDPDINDLNAGYNAGWVDGEAPFCWPDAMGGNGRYDMSNAKYINVAASMGRGAFLLYVYDAASATPLYKATLTAVAGGVVRDKAMVASNIAAITLINLPSGSYTINVQKTGYTASTVSIAPSIPFSSLAGTYLFYSPFYVGVPRIGTIGAVFNWVDGVKSMDAYIALPNTNTYATSGWAIGKADPGSLANKDPLLDPLLYPYPKPPYARWFRDGGISADGGDPIPMEFIAIKPKPGTTNVPYYSNNSNDKYYFLIKTNNFGTEEVVFRLWVGGKVVYFDINMCASPWLRIGYMAGSSFTPDVVCDNATNAWPYTPPNFAP